MRVGAGREMAVLIMLHQGLDFFAAQFPIVGCLNAFAVGHDEYVGQAGGGRGRSLPSWIPGAATSAQRDGLR